MKLNDIFEDILDFENYSPAMHGFGVDIKMQFFQPGERQPSCGPHVRFFKQRHNDGFWMALDSDPDEITILPGSNWEALIIPEELAILIGKVKNYRIPLLYFWNDPGMDSFELKEMMQQVDDSQEADG